MYEEMNNRRDCYRNQYSLSSLQDEIREVGVMPDQVIVVFTVQNTVKSG